MNAILIIDWTSFSSLVKRFLFFDLAIGDFDVEKIVAAEMKRNLVSFGLVLYLLKPGTRADYNNDNIALYHIR